MTAAVAEAAGTIVLRRREERRLLSGHSWVFSNEIERIDGSPAAGSTVSVTRSDGKLVGYGFFNPGSLIAVRIFSRRDPALDVDRISSRLRKAAALRERLYPGSTACRLVHGESDGLPGLIVDRFGSAFSLQTFSLGMDLLKDSVCDVLESVFGAKVVVERNESPLRTLEGLPPATGVLRGSLPEEVEISESDVLFEVDVLQGHKTGFYYDQRENRLALRRYASGAKALDMYCNDGAFALHLAKAGALEVTGIDASEPAVQRAVRNAERNRLTTICSFQTGDAQDALRAMQ